jgi:hypothetical protein
MQASRVAEMHPCRTHRKRRRRKGRNFLAVSASNAFIKTQPKPNRFPTENGGGASSSMCKVRCNHAIDPMTVICQADDRHPSGTREWRAPRGPNRRKITAFLTRRIE